jgi:hypothetical protein
MRMFQPTKTDLDQQLDHIAYELRVAADDLEQAAERVRTGDTLLDVAPTLMDVHSLLIAKARQTI